MRRSQFIVLRLSLPDSPLQSTFDRLVTVSPIDTAFAVINQSASLSLNYAVKVRQNGPHSGMKMYEIDAFIL